MKKWRRRRYFINSSVQSRHMCMAALMVFIISILAGWAVYSNIWYALTDQIQGEPRLHLIMAEANENLLIRSFLVIAGGMSCAVILTLFISHRTAGPMFRIRKTLEEIASGFIPGKINLRKRDEFKELADSVNSAIAKAEEMNGHNKEAVENIKRMLQELKPAEKDKISEIAARVDGIMLFGKN